MSHLSNILKIAWTSHVFNDKFLHCLKLINPSLINFEFKRNLRSINNIQLVRPERYRPYHPVRSGDLEAYPELNLDALKIPFQEVEDLLGDNKEVRKVFSLKLQFDSLRVKYYQNELMDRVRTHPYEQNSLPLRIAKTTGKLRYLQVYLEKKPHDGFKRREANNLVTKRFAHLTALRRLDVKKFEWVLEKLNVTYKPLPVQSNILSEKESLTNLIKLKNERLKEAKLAEAKKEFDEKKIPFLEKKLEKLKWIMRKEEEVGLERSVTDEDINKLVEKIKNVKLDLGRKENMSYERKIHPYTLEPYVPDQLKSKIIE